jgi:hypothetical protein
MIKLATFEYVESRFFTEARREVRTVEYIAEGGGKQPSIIFLI